MTTKAPIALNAQHPMAQAAFALMNTMHAYGEAIGRASTATLHADNPFPAPMDNAPVFFDRAKNHNPIAAPEGYGLCNVDISAVEERIEGNAGNARFWRVILKAMPLQVHEAAFKAMDAMLDAMEAEGFERKDTLFGLGTFLGRYTFPSATNPARNVNDAILGIFALVLVLNHAEHDTTTATTIRTALATLDACTLARAYGMNTVHLHAMGPKPLPSTIQAGAQRALLAYGGQCFNPYAMTTAA